MHQNQFKNRVRIGVLFSSLSVEFQTNYIKHLTSYCETIGVDILNYSGLLYFPDDDIKSPCNMYNIVKRSISNNDIDGMIILAGAISDLFKINELRDLVISLSPIPIVSIGVDIPGIPSVLIDNENGIKKIVKHLVHDHNYKNIGFIKGPNGHREADKRLYSYKKALITEGIEVKESLITDGGSFTESAGEKGAKYLINKNRNIDVILAADDTIAIGSLKYLNKKSTRVNIPVAGFDNIKMDSRPGLTTISQQFFLQSKTSVDLLLKNINGEKNLNNIVIPTELVIRESCGCSEEKLSKIASTSRSINIIRLRLEDKLEYAVKLKDKNIFINYLNEVLSSNSTSIKPAIILEKLISSILEKNISLQQNRDLFIQFYKGFIDAFYDFKIIEKDRYAETTAKINLLTNNLLSKSTLNSLLATLDKGLDNLNIDESYIVLYKKDNLISFRSYDTSSKLQLIYATNEDYHIHFEGNRLLPNKLLKNNKSYIYIPLTYKKIHYGYMVFSYTTDFNFKVLETISVTLSKALYGCFAIKELKISSLHKSNYFVDIANKIKNPLTIISKYLQKYSDTDGKELNNANKTINRLVSGIRKTLEYEKLSLNDNFYVHQEILNIKSVLNEKVELFGDYAMESDITISLICPDDPVIKMNPVALSNVLNCLLDNAIRYNEPGGVVNILVSEEQKYVRFTISNTGKLLSHVDTIFDPYKKKHEGIGLVLTKKIVNSVKGSISIDTKSNCTTFEILLPLTDITVNTDELSTISGKALETIYKLNLNEQNHRPDRYDIVVYGSSKSLLPYLVDLFESNYNIHVGKDSSEILNIIMTKTSPDLLLIDFSHKQNNALEFISMIRKKEDFATLPIIIITESKYNNEHIKALRTGATDYLQKPFNSSDIALKINSLLCYKKTVISNTKLEIKEKLKLYLSNDVATSPNEGNNNNYKLTNKELYIIALLKEGKLYKEIAEHMGISQNTVKSHIYRIYKKCNINNKIELYNLNI